MKKGYEIQESTATYDSTTEILTLEIPVGGKITLQREAIDALIDLVGSAPTKLTAKSIMEIQAKVNNQIPSYESSIDSKYKIAKLVETKIGDVTKKDYKVDPDAVMKLSDRVKVLEEKVNLLMEVIAPEADKTARFGKSYLTNFGLVTVSGSTGKTKVTPIN